MVPGFGISRIVTVSALVLSFHAVAVGGPFVFSLDNRPQAPISIDPAGAGNGAEDPFGQVVAPILVGPSPSLLTHSVPPGRTLSDADILVPGAALPMVNTARPLDTNYVDSISTNQASVAGSTLRLAFSVDRASSGVPLSAVRDQFALNQQPGDIFLTERDFPDPGQFVGTLVGLGPPGWVGSLVGAGALGSNSLLLNQSALKLTAGMGPGTFIESTDLAPPIGPASHDNVDAFDVSLPDTSGDLIADKQIYYSVNPDQPTLIPNPFGYTSAADIYRTAPGSQLPTSFAAAIALGLDRMPPGMIDPNTDDVDALIVYDLGLVGVLEPEVDFALFSLSPGSQSLLTYGLTAADVFFTDFSHRFATYATDAALGLSGTAKPAELGGPGAGAGAGLEPSGNDNLDALGSFPLGDMDWNGSLDPDDDVDDFVQGLTRPDDYRDVNLDHFGQPATILGDFSVPRDGLVDFDDVVPFRTAITGGGGPTPGQGVPEPGALALAAIALAVRVRMRRRGKRAPSATTFGRTSGAQPEFREGFTLIELLAVITIIGVLLGLLLPAVQAAREASRSALCSDHLKQLALAIHAYHSSHNHFPSGSTLASREDEPGDSWHVYCLAYLEEQEVADQILKQRKSVAPAIPIFFCPSDPVLIGGANDLHVTHYSGSAGAGSDPEYVIDLEDKFCGDVYTDGVFYPLSKIAAKNITDGLTHTLAIGERTMIKHIWTKGAFWVGSADVRLCLMASKNVRWPINSPPTTSGYYVFDAQAPSALRTLRMNDLYFGSSHPGGAWFSFAGGNVHFIADDIAFTVYQDLATRNGGLRASFAGSP